MKKGNLCTIVIGICIILLTSCTNTVTQNENPMYSSIALENEINIFYEDTQSQVVDLTKNDSITQNATQNNLLESLDLTTDTLPVNRDELHYEMMVLNNNPDDFTDELQYQATITEESIGDYKLSVSNFTGDIPTINASVFVDDEMISNQIYMNELAEVHFDINRSLIGKTLKVLMSTSLLKTGKADVTISRR